MTNQAIIAWLLAGDVSIQYQTHRDLLHAERPDLQLRIATEGWGAAYLSRRNADGSWGRGFYQPKWISTHYTLLDLRNFAVAPDQPQIRDSVVQVLTRHKGAGGGVNPARSIELSEICVTGMCLNYACYFGAPPELLVSVVDYILGEQMSDGGFNCQRTRPGAHHSSLHSTLSVLEGILEYTRQGYTYRAAELEQAAAAGREFILLHRLYKSDHTGAIIRRDFLHLAFPPRWKYNILRALDYFRAAGVPWDARMADARAVLLARRKADGRWLAEAAHPGEVHLIMETPRQPSRWNTLLALRVLNAFGATT